MRCICLSILDFIKKAELDFHKSNILFKFIKVYIFLALYTFLDYQQVIPE